MEVSALRTAWNFADRVSSVMYTHATSELRRSREYPRRLLPFAALLFPSTSVAVY